MRLGSCGPERIAANQERHWLATLAGRMASPVNVMLIVLSVVSIFVHDYGAATMIGGMIVSLAAWQKRAATAPWRRCAPWSTPR